MKNHHAVLVLILASFLFSLNSGLNRFVPAEIGVFYQLFIKTSLASILFLAAGFIFKDFLRISRSDLPLFILRGLLVVGDFATFFIAITHLPLGTTLLLFYAGSVITSYFYGAIIFKEKLTKIKMLCVFFAFTGLAIMYAGELSTLGNVYFLAALFSGICFGLIAPTSKNLSGKYSINQINLVAYVISAVLSLPLALLNKETIVTTMPFSSWMVFVGLALTLSLAFYGTLYGFKYIEAQKASLILLAEILFVIIIGFFFFQEVPTVNTIIGGFFILIALVLPNVKLSTKLL